MTAPGAAPVDPFPALDLPAGLVTTRRTEAADAAFLRELFDATRAEEFAGLAPGALSGLLELQYRARQAAYRTQFPEAEDRLVVLGGTAVGRILVDRPPGSIHLVDVALMPAHRNAGIGTALLRALQREAAAAGRTLSLHVERHNRAAQLYVRLGFERIAEQDPYWRMEWRPGAEASGS